MQRLKLVARHPFRWFLCCGGRTGRSGPIAVPSGERRPGSRQQPPLPESGVPRAADSRPSRRAAVRQQTAALRCAPPADRRWAARLRAAGAARPSAIRRCALTVGRPTLEMHLVACRGGREGNSSLHPPPPQGREACGETGRRGGGGERKCTDAGHGTWLTSGAPEVRK